MDYRHVFFNTQGRLSPRTFGQGYIILTGLVVILTVLGLVITPEFSNLQIALFFPYLCVFGKRLHDAGQSAWLWLAILVVWVLMNGIATMVLMQVMTPQTYVMYTELVEAMISATTMSPEELQAKAQLVARMSAVPNLAGYLISAAIVGFVAYSLRSDPKPNRHGPPASGSGRSDPRS